MDAKEILKAKKDIVMPVVLENMPTGEPKLHYEMIRDYPQRGGKYLRPALILIACEAMGGNPDDALITAAAYEMCQDWLLIHDDWEDGSDNRRGAPCLHVMHGDILAVNAGDALQAHQWGTLLKNREIIGDDKSFDVLDEMYRLIMRTAEGQAMELGWVHNKSWDVTEEDYFTMIFKKTSGYTVTYPIRLGALIAGRKDVVDQFNDFGDNLGMAFQLQDDILNLVAEEDKYGKEIGGDIYEGKRTLILLHLMKTLQGEEKEKALAIMNKSREEKTEEEVKYILELMNKHGSIEYAIGKAKEKCEIAKELFPKLPLQEGKAKEELRAIVDYVVDRDL